MADKSTETLIHALKQAMMAPREQRLFKSGKLEGLFPGRSGVNAEAATRCLQHGLLEVVRTEIKGKTTVEWVRLTPRGVEFLHQHDSPLQALDELRRLLQTTRDGLPAWLAQIQEELKHLSARLADNVQTWTHHLESLSQRVEESLRRADAGQQPLPNGAAAQVPWALDALVYLDRRQGQAGNGPCPLPELFAALRRQHTGLSIAAYHDGLRRLYDRRALQLLPFAGSSTELPEPEFALPDGSAIFYYATR